MTTATTSSRTVTTKVHLRNDPQTSTAIWSACRQQAAAHNRAVEHLLDQPDEPLRKSSAKGQPGLQGRWLQWRYERPELKDMPQAVWRGGVAAAKARCDRWNEVNAEHAAAVLAADEKGTPIPRAVQRRTPDPKSLYLRRKNRDRRRSNRLVILEGVRRLDNRRVHIPGVGAVTTRDEVPDEVRSCTVVETTPRCRGTNAKPGERSWRVHVQHRVEAPKPPAEPKTSVGNDHGIVHAMTAVDDTGTVTHYQHDRAEIEASNHKVRKLHRAAATRCRESSRRWKRRKYLARQARRRQLNRNQHRRVQWPNTLATGYDLVAVEKLNAANLLRSARGTSEQPGANVKQKRGLSRALAGIAPAAQTTAIKDACRRHGSIFIAVASRNTSIRCSQCGHTDRKNRESQAAFRCVKCGYAANADANAGENIRRRGVEQARARVNGSGGKPEAPSSAGNRQRGNQGPTGRRTLRRTENSVVRKDSEPDRDAAPEAATTTRSRPQSLI